MDSFERIRLTTFSSAGGSANEVSAADLAQVLRHLPPAADANVLAGFGTDGAGAYKLSDELALVQSVELVTPIVDDPYDFGRIAAVNALCGVYAMGGKPLTALSVAAYPVEDYGPEMLTKIFAGGAATVREAGATLLGGHAIEDDEPKYGLAVVGTVHPQSVLTNAGAKAGDRLVLTKAVGTGILAAAFKKGAIGEAEMAPAVASMTTLDVAAWQAMREAGVHAAAPVGGHGLLGHADELARASRVRLRIDGKAVPTFALVRDMLAVGVAPGAARKNAREHTQFTTFAEDVSAETRLILADPQTSGGLLIAVPPSALAQLLAALRENGSVAAEIGVVEAGSGIFVR